MYTEPQGRGVDIYLLNGSPSGPRQASLDGWNAHVTSIPRIYLLEDELLEDLNGAHGVCLLTGQDTAGDPFVHICWGSDVLALLKQDFDFERRGMFWSEAAVITAYGEILDRRRLVWLTARLTSMARTAGHAVSVSSTETEEPGVPRRIRGTLETFVQNACTVLPVLGCTVLEPSPSQTEDDDLLPGFLYFQHPDTPKEELWDTAAWPDRNGFWVLKGSRILPPPPGSSSSLLNSAVSGRAPRVSDGYLDEDVLFTSPVTAALFVSGGTCSDPSVWKNDSGISLYPAVPEPASAPGCEPVPAGREPSVPDAPSEAVTAEIPETVPDLDVPGTAPDTDADAPGAAPDTADSSEEEDEDWDEYLDADDGDEDDYSDEDEDEDEEEDVDEDISFDEEDDEDGEEPRPVRYHIQRGRANATGIKTADGFLVLEGSTIVTDAPNCPYDISKNRTFLVSSGILYAGRFYEDAMFRSAEDAASFILGEFASAGSWTAETEPAAEGSTVVPGSQPQVPREKDRADRFVEDDPSLFRLTGEGPRASGRIEAGGFTVCRGSEMEQWERPGLAETYRSLRRQLQLDGTVKDWVFTRDYKFAGPVTATACILGSNVSSSSMWETSRGITLDWAMRNRDQFSSSTGRSS